MLVCARGRLAVSSLRPTDDDDVDRFGRDARGGCEGYCCLSYLTNHLRVLYGIPVKEL